ncbi:MAG: transketolase family protein [Pseudomonadota bacterium]
MSRMSKYQKRTPTQKGKGLRTSAMIASIAEEGVPTITAPFGHTLNELALHDDKIVGLTADLSKYTDLHVFAEQNPDRFYQMGMAEAVMISTAAGLAREGFTAFATTYCVFASRRAYDFIIMAIAEESLNVKIVCALPGLTTGYGPSHQATEDLAIMRGMPNLTIIDPCCATDITQATRAIAAHQGPVYMRLLRGKVPNILYEYNYQFTLGKAKMIRDGRDILFVSTGLMTMRVLDAAKKLAQDRIDCAVLHVPTIKPLDIATIHKEAQKSGRLVITAENHTIIGGMGEAVAASMMRNGIFVPLRQIALPDEFLDAGALPTLHDLYGLSVARVVTQTKEWLAQ